MSYSKEELVVLAEEYRSTLLDDVLPFWLPRVLDKEHGGYLISRDQDGSLLDDDKSVWQQGRFSWLLATLYNTLDQRSEWLDAAGYGIRFLRDHCFDPEDGRMYFHMTREGKPIRKRRYYFSECFATIAYASYSKAVDDEDLANEAVKLFERCVGYYQNPDVLPEKFTDVRPVKGIGAPMILLNVAQQLRETISLKEADKWIDHFINEIRECFVKPEIECNLMACQ